MRCFIAAWPDETARLALEQLTDDAQLRIAHRRATRADDLHLTLAFIGDLDDGAAFDLAAAITTLQFEPFDWQLNRLGFFEQARVVWAGSNQTAPLDDLANRARALLDRTGITYDRRPLAPHVTLLRGVKDFTTEAITPIKWRVASVALYRSAPSLQASRYVRVAR